MDITLVVFAPKDAAPEQKYEFLDSELGADDAISEIQFTDICVHGDAIQDDTFPAYQVRTHGEDHLYNVLHINTLAVRIEAITGVNNRTIVYVRSY